jgi:hypothetical protein
MLMTRKPGAPVTVQSLTAEFCGLSLSGPASSKEDEEERNGLLRANFAHRFLAYTQAHTIFR